MRDRVIRRLTGSRGRAILLRPAVLAVVAGVIFACVWLMAAPLADHLLMGLPPRKPTSGDVLEAVFSAGVWSALMYFLFFRRWLG
jgi:hypothetical protein